MTSNRFFIQRDGLQFPSAVLEGEEHHHLSVVARIKIKDTVWLFDDEGHHFLARVEEINRSNTRLTILEEKKRTEPRVHITLAQGILKQKKMDWVVQKATELGMMRFIPVITSRAIVKIDEKADKKLSRWKKIALMATKQCGRSVLPEIQLPQKLADVLGESRESKKLCLSSTSGRYLKDILCPKSETESGHFYPSLALLVGPEGGWTDEEETAIVEHDFEAVSLGMNVLRSETAALVGTAMIYHFWNT